MLNPPIRIINSKILARFTRHPLGARKIGQADKWINAVEITSGSFVFHSVKDLKYGSYESSDFVFVIRFRPPAGLRESQGLTIEELRQGAEHPLRSFPRGFG